MEIKEISNSVIQWTPPEDEYRDLTVMMKLKSGGGWFQAGGNVRYHSRPHTRVLAIHNRGKAAQVFVAYRTPEGMKKSNIIWVGEKVKDDGAEVWSMYEDRISTCNQWIEHHEKFLLKAKNDNRPVGEREHGEALAAFEKAKEAYELSLGEKRENVLPSLHKYFQTAFRESKEAFESDMINPEPPANEWKFDGNGRWFYARKWAGQNRNTPKLYIPDHGGAITFEHPQKYFGTTFRWMTQTSSGWQIADKLSDRGRDIGRSFSDCELVISATDNACDDVLFHIPKLPDYKGEVQDEVKEIVEKVNKRTRSNYIKGLLKRLMAKLRHKH